MPELPLSFPKRNAVLGGLIRPCRRLSPSERRTKLVSSGWFEGEGIFSANVPTTTTTRRLKLDLYPSGGFVDFPDAPRTLTGNEQESQNPKKKKQAVQEHSPGHIFWVIPAYKVEYGTGFQPLTPKEKFHEWLQETYDPLGTAALGFEAGTLEYSSTDGFCGYGYGLSGYGKCFGSMELDATDSSFIGDFLLPVVLHQDPRYFRLGRGSFGKRVWYAVERVFVTYNDSGKTVFYSSALSGTAIAAALSNFYYPSQDVGVKHTITRATIDLGNTALYNLAAEFWPDIHHKIDRIF